MATINLWTAMLDVESLSERSKIEAPSTEDAAAVTAEAKEGALFERQEIVLEVDKCGWRVSLIGNDDTGGGHVVLFVSRQGGVSVERDMLHGDIREVRRVSF
jgi:hypothetical protein